MVVELPLEEQLMVEKQVRAVYDCDDTESVNQLCASLIRQTHHQQRLLSQALGRIIELEIIEECQGESEPAKAKSSWWRNLFMRMKP